MRAHSELEALNHTTRHLNTFPSAVEYLPLKPYVYGLLPDPSSNHPTLHTCHHIRPHKLSASAPVTPGPTWQSAARGSKACSTSTDTQHGGAGAQALTERSPCRSADWHLRALGWREPALRKGLHNPRCFLGQVPSLVTSALPWQGAASITSFIPVTAPVLGQPGPQEWHLPT